MTQFPTTHWLKQINWGISKKSLNNGVLIVMSKNLREIHIRNGRGIEEAFTDAETELILDSLIFPEFKKDKYYLGIMQGFEGAEMRRPVWLGSVTHGLKSLA